MKCLALLNFTIATLFAPIQGQAETRCITFPSGTNMLPYLLSHPGTVVCPSHPDPQGQARILQQISQQRAYNSQRLMCSMSGRVC